MTNPETSTLPTTRVFGRCIAKGCTTKLVMEVAITSTAAHGVIVKEDRRRMFDAENEILLATCCRGQRNRGDHGLKWTRLKGKFVEGIKCTSRCAKGTGYDCKCECGGENHGSAAVH
jgi:hypothetical protein